jgi:hypothetical protein
MVNNPNKCDDVDEDDQPRGTKRVRKKVTVMSNLLSSPPPFPLLKSNGSYVLKVAKTIVKVPCCQKNESPLFIFRAGSFARLIRQTAEEAEKLTCGGELHVR